MSADNDLIRRGDVLDAMCKGPRTVQERIDAIRVIIAQPDPRDEVIAKLVEALKRYKSGARRVPFDLAVSSDAALAAAKAVQP